MDISEYAFEKLGDDGHVALFRGRRNADSRALLAMVPVSEQPVPGIVARFTHAYSIRDELDISCVACPREVVLHKGRRKLLLDDPGGELLAILMGRPMELLPFLRIAIGIASALGRFHAGGFIHKNITPENILVDAETGSAWLTGVGFSSRLPRQRQEAAPPEGIEGSLAYMAPEQTGRVNRSMDSRTDLYAFGVTLYEMLTGTLPFTATDPMEWVHCHIAREPISPGERAAGIPPVVSDIVIKLLAKAQESRYQTAAGVEADLRSCLVNLETQGGIDPFQLGMDDVSDRLVIPEKLYGREQEIEQLHAAFDRVVSEGTAELALVSGYSGVGKSSVVNELHKALVPSRGLFASGKFDQYKRGIPYATLAQAFEKLVRQILTQSDGEVRRWRESLLDALGPNGQLIVTLIPEIEIIIGKQAPVADLAPRDMKSRFQRVLRNFIAVFARPEHPLALFLDDLQWIDVPTLELIEHLFAESDERHLLIVGAYRDNEVGSAHPLMRTVNAIERAGAHIEQIVLKPLALRDVELLLADTIHAAAEELRPLAELVFEKTGGNPFFAVQFLMALTEEGLLLFDIGSAAWTWDVGRISSKGFTENVLDLMSAKLDRLPEMTKVALGQLACLGSVTEVKMMKLALGADREEIHADLWHAVRAGLIFRNDGRYAFSHDRVQEAAYALVCSDDRAAAHLQIARVLISQLGSAQVEESIFEIVNHFDHGVALIDSRDERERVAELNLTAARRAMSATAYASALTYLSAGRELLSEDCWENQYRLAFNFELLRAECEFATGSLVAAEERLSNLSERSTNFLDLSSVVRLRMSLLTTMDKAGRAIEVGQDFLSRVGICLAPHPGEADVAQLLDRMRELVDGRPVEILVDLAPMTDPKLLAAMDVLADFLAPASFIDNNLLDLAVLRMVNLSLEHGNCDASACAYTLLSIVLGLGMGDYPMALRFGKLGYDLVESRGMDRFKTKVYTLFGTSVLPWSQPLASSRPVLRKAIDEASTSGDLTYAAYSRRSLIANLMVSGEPLAEVNRELDSALAFVRAAKLGPIADTFESSLLLVRSLRGEESAQGPSGDLEKEDPKFSRNLTQGGARLPVSAARYWIHQMQARYFADDLKGVLSASSKASGLLWSVRQFLEIVEFHFYRALTLAAGFESVPAEQRPAVLGEIEAHRRQVAEWAKGCADNHAHRVALIAAEIARLENRHSESEVLYEEAVHLARAHGFIQNEGIANELAAKFHAGRGLGTVSDAYLRNARSCYARWGALAKVRQLDESHPQLATQSAAAAPTLGSLLGELDIATVVKASQALSGEIRLDDLIETLMRIVIGHAGAERGLLIVVRDGVPRIEAEATIGLSGIEIVVRSGVISDELPESVLNYVIRTRESVLLNDAAERNLYSEDKYFRRRRSRSVLCLPIRKQATLVGALYLENDLASHVFTAGRIAVLDLLASQAAISLENARLYADLERENVERKRAEEKVRLSERELRMAIETIPALAWNTLADGSNESLSKQWHAYTGMTPEAALNKGWLNTYHPDDVDKVIGKWMEMLAEGKGGAVEARIRRFDGEYRAFLVRAVPLRDESGAITKWYGTSTDIEDLKRAEVELRLREAALRKAEADLAHVSRVTTMGELTASIAHELNQPLTGIVMGGNAGLRWLERDSPNLPEAREAIERVVKEGKRAGSVIARIRKLFKKGEPVRERLEINEVIEEVTVFTRNELQKANVTQRLDFTSDLPPVLADRVQIQRVLMNLILNAIDAMRDVTTPRVLTIRTMRVGNEFVSAAVTDSGMGIDPEESVRIFETFHTTKPGGMGMGLTICRSIVQSHGGQLRVMPHDGPGATFEFTLSTNLTDLREGACQ